MFHVKFDYFAERQTLWNERKAFRVKSQPLPSDSFLLFQESRTISDIIYYYPLESGKNLTLEVSISQVFAVTFFCLLPFMFLQNPDPFWIVEDHKLLILR
jgi:hypothetical protein